MNRKFVFTILALAFSGMALASVKVTSLDLKTVGDNGYISIQLDGRSNDLPDLRVYGNVIELSLDKATAFSGISKTVKGAFLSANVLNGKAIIKTILPYAVSAEKVNVGWKNSSIEVSFPRGAAATATSEQVHKPINSTAHEVAPKEIKPVSPTKSVAQKTATALSLETSEPQPKNSEQQPENKISKDLLNEDYLNKLMKDQTAGKDQDNPVEIKKDSVTTKQAAPGTKEATDAPINVIPKVEAGGNKFSFAGYAVKFTLFLAVVLGLFYGVVQLLKKGVFNRGKLGFLNNTQMIQVLSTTYLAPKRSLMVVKVHKQIFLVANSETGLTFLSEMTDTSGLIKDGEKAVTGTNFDEKLDVASAQQGYDAFIKVKENIMESTPTNDDFKALAKLASVKDDVVKFSDELKKKAKKLRPIEFN